MNLLGKLGREEGRVHPSNRKQDQVEGASLLSTCSLTIAIALIGVASLICLLLFLNRGLDISVLSARKIPIYQKQKRGVRLAERFIESTASGFSGNHTSKYKVEGEDIHSSSGDIPFINDSTLDIRTEDLNTESGIICDGDGIEMTLPDNLQVELDVDLNPNVNTSLPLRDGFFQTEFDKEIFQLQNDHVVLHQTWKDTCVLETKKKYMLSWQKREENLKVIFWTDSLMETWVSERFSGTYIYEAWLRIGTTRDAHIKKADVFRVMLMWYYGGVYADLDIKLKRSLRDFLKQGSTVIVWEPEQSMLQWTEYEEGSPRKTLVLSGFLISGHRFSNFLGFYINWVAENHLSGRSKWEDHVIDSTGPRVEAEAYYYYTGRVKHHDRLLHVQTYPQFFNYGEHFSETTWVPDAIKDIACIEIDTVYSQEVLIMGQPS